MLPLAQEFRHPDCFARGKSQEATTPPEPAMSTLVQTMPILVVDDDEVLGQVLTRALTREGRTIVPANSMAQALEAARRQRPRLALLDLCLPDGDGVELARKLQAEYPDLPLILMTAYPL